MLGSSPDYIVYARVICLHRLRRMHRSFPTDQRHASADNANVNTRALIELMEQAELLRQEQEQERQARAQAELEVSC